MEYYIYTDGSAKNNGSESSIGGYGFVVTDSSGRLIDAYAKTNIENTTNNRMELTAILAALFMYEKRMRIKDERAYIYLFSDSNYALNSLFKWCPEWERNEWKTASGSDVKNLDLIQNFYNKQWKPYLENMRDGKRNSWSRFSYQYVQGHATSKWNNIADKLATGQITPEDVLKNE